MQPRRRAARWWTLAAILAAGAALRFWRLGDKPVWLDEAMTMLIAAGRGPDDLPTNTAFALSDIARLFNPLTTSSWRESVALLSDGRVQHTHPPLFYVIAHAALVVRTSTSLVWSVRAVAALFGVCVIPAIYAAAREAYDDTTALIAAGLAALSPWGVLLSQDARNYTLALFLVTMSTLASIAIVKRMNAGDGRVPVRWWLLWTAASVLGFYAHYFAALVWCAQTMVLIAHLKPSSSNTMSRSRSAMALAIAVLAAVAACLPWARVLRAHLVSPEQQWMALTRWTDWPMTGYETLSAWQSMFLGVAWSGPSAGVENASRMFALAAGAWALAMCVAAWRGALRGPDAPATRALAAIAGLVLVEFFVAMIATGKDLMSEARYHFAYYPPLVIVAARILAALPPRSASVWPVRAIRPARTVAVAAIFALGLFNAALVAAGTERWKAARPERVAAQLGTSCPGPIAIAVGTGSFHESVTHLAHFYEFERRFHPTGMSFALVSRSDFYAPPESYVDPAIFLRNLITVAWPAAPATVWAHVTGLRGSEYDVALVLTTRDGAHVVCHVVSSAPAADEEPILIVAPRYRQYRCQAK